MLRAVPRPSRRLVLLLVLALSLTGAVLSRHSTAGAAGLDPGTCAAPQTVNVPTLSGYGTQTVEKYVMWPRLQSLVSLVKTRGHTLTVNSGYRTCDQQIALRRQNCGTSDYAVYDEPSTSCSPATAKPGHSNHNYGLAVDLGCDGVLIANDPSCLAVVRQVAPQAGLMNYTPEVWHWGVSDENNPAADYADDHAPTGSLDQVTTVAGGVRLQGWVADRDAQAVPVWYVVDGTVVGVGTAAGSRPDVQAAGQSPGAQSGVDVTITVAPGVHSICLRSQGNQVNRPPTDTACQTATVRPLRGSLDSATAQTGGVRVSGWGFDPASTASTLTVEVRVDGAPVATTTAAAARPDVARAYGVGANHGFATTVVVGAGAHQVCALGVNSSNGYGNTVLGCSTVTLTAPKGTVDTASGVLTGIHLAGWAFDPDAGSTPTTLHVTLDGRASTVTANTSRPDVGAAYGVGPNHGFDTVLVPISVGSHTVCVTVDDIPTAAFVTDLGCRSVQWPVLTSAAQASPPPVTLPGVTLPGVALPGVTLPGTVRRGRSR